MVSDLEAAQKMVADLQATNQILEAKIYLMEQPDAATAWSSNESGGLLACARPSIASCVTTS